MRLAITAPAFEGEPPPSWFNIARHCLARQAMMTPHKPALIIAADANEGGGDEIWTYRRLEDAVLRLGAALSAQGLAPGERVLVRLGNSSNAAIAFLAAISIGAVPILVSSLLAAPEVEFLAEDSGARLIITASDLPVGRAADGRVMLDEADLQAFIAQYDPAPYAATRANDPGFLIYTSGTTGNPKGVLHAQRALWGRRPMYTGWYDLRPDDIVLHAGALNWTYTIGTGLMDPLAAGATAVIYSGERAPELWPLLIERTSATLFAAVPTLYRQILKYADITPHRMPTLRHGLTAGEALRPEVADEWQQRTGRVLYEAFGMSEISTYVSSAPTVIPKPGAPGRPQPGRAVAILPVEDGFDPVKFGESGVIAVHRSDPGLMLGYWNLSGEEAFRGEWFVTGDLATMDEDFYIRPQGRSDDLMNVLGYRVSPAEVEAAVSAFPGIAEAAAVAVDVRPGVSIIKAFVVPQEGAVLEPGEVLADASSRLAAYKMPREIVMLDSLPRTANGKVRRDVLRGRAT